LPTSFASANHTWTLLNNTPDVTGSYYGILGIKDDGTRIIVGVTDHRVYASEDNGSTWQETQPAGDVDRGWYLNTTFFNENVVVAGFSTGRLYISDDSGSTWQETQPVGDQDVPWAFASADSDGSKIIVGGTRLYISSNSGSTWQEAQPAGDIDSDWEYASVNEDGSKIIVTNSSRIYISNDGGSTWQETQPEGDVDLNFSWGISMSSDGSKIITAVSGGRLYISNDGGSTWQETQPAGDVNVDWYLAELSEDGQKMIVTTCGGGENHVFMSEDLGITWDEIMIGGGGSCWDIISTTPDFSYILLTDSSAPALYLGVLDNNEQVNENNQSNSSSGSSAQSQVQNLISMGKIEIAQQIINQYSNQFNQTINTCSVFGSYALVKKGIRGLNAKSVQEAINQMKVNTIPIITDGIIGPKSLEGIRLAQTKLGTNPDGVWGPVTQGLYENWVRGGCK
jgi:photosystem II stability/assembly factor-like uncharacterized protein